MRLTPYDLTRRFVLTKTVSGIFAALAAPSLAAAAPFRSASAERQAAQQPARTTPAVPERPPALTPTLVEEFVRKAHGDLAATKTLLAETPGLLNATWDWGGGDFEMGIGGAGHMGNREIAEFLIGQGGRMDIFVAAMLGHLDIVKAMLAAYPGLLHSKGPHGIPLMVHAKKGGPRAEPVVVFLESQGLKS
jgi:hypothetical protein